MFFQKQRIPPTTQLRNKTTLLLSQMSDPTKKRKRNAEGGAKVSKKVAIEAPATSNVHFSLRENKGSLAPVIGTCNCINTIISVN